MLIGRRVKVHFRSHYTFCDTCHLFLKQTLCPTVYSVFLTSRYIAHTPYMDVVFCSKPSMAMTQFVVLNTHLGILRLELCLIRLVFDVFRDILGFFYIMEGFRVQTQNCPKSTVNAWSHDHLPQCASWPLAGNSGRVQEPKHFYILHVCGHSHTSFYLIW